MHFRPQQILCNSHVKSILESEGGRFRGGNNAAGGSTHAEVIFLLVARYSVRAALKEMRPPKAASKK